MTMTFMVKTKPGDVHAIRRKDYEVVRVRKLKVGWRVDLEALRGGKK